MAASGPVNPGRSAGFKVGELLILATSGFWSYQRGLPFWVFWSQEMSFFD